jgi:hypothetical protein
MWHYKQVLQASSFTFDSYTIDRARSTVAFTYRVEFKSGRVRTYTDRLVLKDVPPEAWERVPKAVLDSTLQALLLVIGINYWSVFLTKNIKINGFKLTREQARFWDSLYLNGLGEFWYFNKIDFHNLVAFPYDDSIIAPAPTPFQLPHRALILNGAGKDSILSAEILKASGQQFDYFAFAPSPAHERIAKLVGAKTITANRYRDWRKAWISLALGLSTSYPSVSTFTFVATLLAELLGYNSIILSNERSADIGNFNYLGLVVNHQWCKASEAEQMINDYIQRFITPAISTFSPLRKFSELEIVRQFVRYPQYLYDFTSCNTYFWLPAIQQRLLRKNYWCNRCPKCVFLFACFSAFLPKPEVVRMFGANLYAKKRLLPLFRQILGIEGFKPLDCVGEPEEMILAMHYASRRKEYSKDVAIRMFEARFPTNYDFNKFAQKVFVAGQ